MSSANINCLSKNLFYNKISSLRLAGLSLIFLLVASIIPFAHASPIFGNVNSNGLVPTYDDIAIKANGSNVYVGYADTNFIGIGLVASSDNGTTFPTTNFLYGCAGCVNFPTESEPQIAVSGNNLYVAWFNMDGDISFARSQDNGATYSDCGFVSPNIYFPCPDITTTGYQLGSYQQSGPNIAVYGKNVYLEWLDNNGSVAFDASHDYGTTWDHIMEVSHSDNVHTPQMSASGSNVYLTWQDLTVSSGGDIETLVITNNGTTISTYNNVSNTPGQESQTPQIASFANNVYQTWQEYYSGSNADVFFTSSANNATSFASKVNLSNSAGYAADPHIAANGTNVYVVWDDTGTGNGFSDIMFKASSDNGVTFASQINISNNPATSLYPKVALSGSNVYVAWLDNTIDPSGDILFKSSPDNGATFGGVKKLNTSTFSISQDKMQISASSKNISVDWPDSAPNVNYVSAINSPIDVQFDQAQYSLNTTATITVIDPASNTNPATAQTINIGVSSTTDSTGIASLPLVETGPNTGIFNGTVTFTSASTFGTTLKASPGDIITARYQSQSSVASITPIIVAFDAPGGYGRGNFAHLTIKDPYEHAPNLLAPQTITVHLATDANPDGIDLQLNETGANTYTFGSVATDTLAFMQANNIFPSTGTITITQTNTGANLNPSAIDTIGEVITSTSDHAGITMNLNETGVNTGIFSGKLTVGNSSVNHLEIKVAPGDFLTVARDTAIANGLITPNPNPSNNIILVTPDPANDTLTATYKGVRVAVPVFQGFDPGGGGGGLVRPGMVFDVAAAFAGTVASTGNGASAYVTPSLSINSLVSSPNNLPSAIKNEILNATPFTVLLPSTDSSVTFPFYINGNGYPLVGTANTIKTDSQTTGVPVTFTLNIPSSGIQGIVLYTNLRANARDIANSDTYIEYDKGQSLKIVDPHKYFEHVSFDLNSNGLLNTLTYKITFANPMQTSDIDFRISNNILASTDTAILNALQVNGTQGSAVPATAADPPAPAPIPTSPDLMSAIKEWAGYSPNPLSDSQFLSQMGLNGDHIPHWVMKSTQFVISGQTTQGDLETAVKYLYDKGMIK